MRFDGNGGRRDTTVSSLPPSPNIVLMQGQTTQLIRDFSLMGRGGENFSISFAQGSGMHS